MPILVPRIILRNIFNEIDISVATLKLDRYYVRGLYCSIPNLTYNRSGAVRSPEADVLGGGGSQTTV